MKWPVAIIRRLAPSRPLSMKAMLWIVAATVLLDQASKILAELHLMGREPVVIIPGLLNLLYAQNTGAAFSMFTGKTFLLGIFSAAISLGVIWFALKLKPEELPLRLPLGLILGGAVGNLIDRARLGYVIDFIHAHWFWKASWPIFNIADSAVCVGVGLIVASFLANPSGAPVTEKKENPKVS